jgi:hypothetical protein
VTWTFADKLGAGSPILGPALNVDPNMGRPPEKRVPDCLPDLYIQNFLFNRIKRVGNYSSRT